MQSGVDDPLIYFRSKFLLIEAKIVQTALFDLCIGVDDVFLKQQTGMMQNVKLISSMMQEK